MNKYPNMAAPAIEVLALLKGVIADQEQFSSILDQLRRGQQVESSLLNNLLKPRLNSRIVVVGWEQFVKATYYSLGLLDAWVAASKGLGSHVNYEYMVPVLRHQPHLGAVAKELKAAGFNLPEGRPLPDLVGEELRALRDIISKVKEVKRVSQARQRLAIQKLAFIAAIIHNQHRYLCNDR